MKWTRTFGLMVAVAFSAALSAQAATLNWTGLGDGTTFGDAANWDAAPTGGTVVLSNLVDDYVINDATANITTANSLVVTTGSVTLQDGNILHTTFEGFDGPGPVTITGGSAIRQFLSLGVQLTLGGTGQLQLNGGGGAINNGGGDVVVNFTSTTSGLTFAAKTASEVVTQYTADLFAGNVAAVFGADPLVAEAGDNFLITENAASGADNVTVSALVIPEPASLMLVGLGGLMMLRRRRVQR